MVVIATGVAVVHKLVPHVRFIRGLIVVMDQVNGLKKYLRYQKLNATTIALQFLTIIPKRQDIVVQAVNLFS